MKSVSSNIFLNKKKSNVLNHSPPSPNVFSNVILLQSTSTTHLSWYICQKSPGYFLLIKILAWLMTFTESRLSILSSNFKTQHAKSSLSVDAQASISIASIVIALGCQKCKEIRRYSIANPNNFSPSFNAMHCGSTGNDQSDKLIHSAHCLPGSLFDQLKLMSLSPHWER